MRAHRLAHVVPMVDRVPSQPVFANPASPAVGQHLAELEQLANVTNVPILSLAVSSFQGLRPVKSFAAKSACPQSIFKCRVSIVRKVHLRHSS